MKDTRWKSGKIVLLRNIGRIRVYYILCDVIKCFAMSCMALMLIFFFSGESVISLTREEIYIEITSIFIVLMPNVLIYEMLWGHNWLYEGTETSKAALSLREKWGQVEEEQNKKGWKSFEYNRTVSAVHEAGHAVMNYLMESEYFDVIMSDIQPKVVRIQKLQNAEEVKKTVLISYAGAVAEEMTFGYFHSGCFGNEEADFSKATAWIKAYIIMTDQGVSKSLLSEELSEQIQRLSKEWWEETKELLTDNRKLVEALSKELMKKESMMYEEIKDFLDQVKDKP